MAHINSNKNGIIIQLYVVEQSDLDFGQDVNRTPKKAKIRIKENTSRRM